MSSSVTFPTIPYIDKKKEASIESFLNISYDRWNDAVVCYKKGNYIAAVYLAGYSVECLLKYIILKCKYSDTDPVILNDIARGDMKKVASHYLDALLDIGNRELLFKVPTKNDYPEIIQWTSEWRYSHFRLDEECAEYFLDQIICLISSIKANISNGNIRIREFSSFKGR